MKTLYIKNMVCDRCKMVVKDQLEALGMEVVELERGKVSVKEPVHKTLNEIDANLRKYGFELLKDPNIKLVEQVKARLITYVNELENQSEIENVSDYLARHLHQSYSSISSTFSEAEGITIEKYIIRLKIEKVKELLSYGELTLGEIAHKLNYSSTAHLSGQFRKITGMSVTDYKKAHESFRKPLDGISD